MRLTTMISASVLMLAAAGASAAMAAETPNPVTVNDYTPAQKAKAFNAAQAKGYTNLEVTAAQAGDLFLKGQAGNQTYMLTVTPQGEVYPSSPLVVPNG